MKSSPKMSVGTLMRYFLHMAGALTGVLLIADWGEREKDVASEVHVKRFNSLETSGFHISMCRRISPTRGTRRTSFLGPFDHMRKDMRMQDDTPPLKDALDSVADNVTCNTSSCRE